MNADPAQIGYAALIIAIPFLGTVLGSLLSLLGKGSGPRWLQQALYGFAGGVMVSASFFSLLMPSLEESNAQLGASLSWIPPVIGFLVGILFLYLLDVLVPHIHPKDSTQEGRSSSMSREGLLFLAMTIHNIPEGLAVGVAIASFLASGSMSLMSALVIGIGIALQNFPEGLAVALPLREKKGKGKSCLYGILSGVVEPLAAILACLLAAYVEPVLPYALSFAAGAMIYVVVEEMIPSKEEGHSNILVLSFAVGFALMMALDVALG